MKMMHDKKVIGLYDKKSGILRKNVKKSFHFFRLGGEWGIDYKMLEKLPETATILLHELENNDYYWLTKKEIEEKGREFLGYSGYGLQRMVKLEDWHTLTEEQKEENEYRRNQGLEARYIPR